LLALIEQQDLNAVSIADVTRRAGVSRSTFYDHYADLHELAESACTEMFEALLAETPVFALIDGPRTGNPLVALFEHVLEHRRLYTALLGALSRWLKSGAAQLGFRAAAMKHRSGVHLSGNDGRGDFPPDREAVSHLGTPFGCAQSVPARPKMR
jgi:AcrR family transcriptional regulator